MQLFWVGAEFALDLGKEFLRCLAIWCSALIPLAKPFVSVGCDQGISGIADKSRNQNKGIRVLNGVPKCFAILKTVVDFK